MDPNVPPPPKIDRILALLERYLTLKRPGLPGGTATQADVDAAQKDSPDKGEPTTYALRAVYATRQPPPQAMTYELFCNTDNSATNSENLTMLKPSTFT
ncbi:benzoate 4-monooxygenase cytochrome P450 [Fusarium mexicanum]|uniref:Benzoate 4-monooxygenase cytochrome P450 n=1 Tax=Fusarium mexicanum TaxID=751941 RepID=A0A8H5MPJ5_9HYPO|nr:benzoate 4-monooxygenase cytochrome P450 [Fusarium mexicanum]